MEKENKKEDAVKSQEPIDQEKEKQRSGLKKASLAIFLLVMLLFLAIIAATDLLSAKFGKTAGTAGLVIIAVALAGYLYRKEIAAKLKRK